MLNKRILTLVFVVAFVTLLVGCIPSQAPIITSDPVKIGEVGLEYTYDVDATDPDEDVLTYSLDIKPTGMDINSVTGLIKWTPTAKGDYDVVVKVSDGTFDIIQSFTIAVSEEEPGYTPTPIKYYTITATADIGGSISPSEKVIVEEGKDKTFTITPTVFYRIYDVLVDGSSVGAVASYTFTNVTAVHTIHADFILIGKVYNQTQDDHYDFIQEAINSSTTYSGDTILVMSGTYEEDVTINVNGLILKSVEKHGAEIKGFVKVQADAVTIEDFYINSDSTINLPPVDLIAIEGVTISGNRIEGGSDAGGINCWTGSDGACGLILIENNEIFKGCVGFYFWSKSALVTIRNNTMIVPADEGIWTVWNSNAILTIENNTVINAGKSDVKIVDKPLSVNGEADETKMAQTILDDNLGINSVYLEWI